MTAFNIEDARKTARLSRLAMNDAELEQRAKQMANILNFVEQLKEVDTSTTEPLANVVDITLKLRDDVVNDGNLQADVLANAPEALEGFFVVPKVVE
jgi:aspartyl-tRNA(Asn)/glutamyl-tRNA(Gln) amidotransferase subunit C